MRRYSNNAAQTALSGSVTADATSITVSSTTGFPAADFVLALDYGTANQELVLVTGVGGTTLTVTRGYDNTTAVSHDVGAAVVHTHSAADFADSRGHEAATTDVHGVTGALASGADLTTLDGEVAAHTDATAGVHGATGAVVGTTDAQALTNKNLTDPTNTFPASLATSADLTAHEADTSAHGVTGIVVGTTDVQALTNKDLSDASNTLPALVPEVTFSTDDGTTSTSIPVPSPLIQAGWFKVTLAGTSLSAGVTFDTPYSSAPAVTLTTNFRNIRASFVGSPGADINGFSCNVNTIDGTSANNTVTINWIAVGTK